MSTSRAFVKTVSSVNLVFGLDWFAILGGTVEREVKRIARQHDATHAVHAGDGAASVGVTTLQAGKRGLVMYSAAQLVAQRFTTGAVAMVVPLDDANWWLVGVHEGAVIARTDHVCRSQAEVSTLIAQLRQAYPSLTVLDTDAGQPSVSDLAGQLHTEAELQRVNTGSRFLTRPYQGLVLAGVLAFLVYRVWGAIDGPHRPDGATGQGTGSHQAWAAAIDKTAGAHWVHGVSGTSDLLNSLYALPIELAGWRLQQLECLSDYSQWRCRADYNRTDPEASNKRFLDAALEHWDVSFAPLDQVQVRWNLVSKGISMAHTALQTRNANERHLFSKLQSIRPAFSLVNIGAPEPVSIPAPTNEQGHAIPRPQGLPQFGRRAVRIQAPLRSIALLLPYCDAFAWHSIVITLNPQIKPDLTHSRLNATLQGVLYEQA